jgi:hypothetical protein
MGCELLILSDFRDDRTPNGYNRSEIQGDLKRARRGGSESSRPFDVQLA